MAFKEIEGNKILWTVSLEVPTVIPPENTSSAVPLFYTLFTYLMAQLMLSALMPLVSIEGEI